MLPAEERIEWRTRLANEKFHLAKDLCFAIGAVSALAFQFYFHDWRITLIGAYSTYFFILRFYKKEYEAAMNSIEETRLLLHSLEDDDSGY